ncbi:hypothetical protein LTR84_001385 [Exophiala bonariae]|uniref:BZIP domain-containing protein n=1 Tax=Exophiala bonariae TaxID=1690606 RepID=A0AAV9NGY8_9EURO|nr:hypothetical protein LTR84_001385 [Exophiala bonariae]
MGLPMFREPDEIAAEQAAAKLDQIAATRRSTIRRESTVRPHRQSPPERDSARRPSPRAQNIHRFRDLISRHQRDQESYTRNAEIETQLDLETQIEFLRRQRMERMRNGIPTSRMSPDALDMFTRAESHLDDSPMNDTSSDLTIDMSTPHALDTVSQNLPRPSRESGLRFEVAASSHSESEQPRRPRYSGRLTRRAGSRAGPPGSGPNIASLTPGFAPAHGPFRQTSQPIDDRFSREPDASSTAVPGLPLSPVLDHPESDTTQNQPPYPPLRRVSHLSPRPMNNTGARVDGLGDRLRSPSPVSDGHDEENWANLLTTIQPGRASNATSFMSSRSDSQSDSNRSSQAATTATSFGEIGGDDSCDLDLPFGITEDDVRDIRARAGRLRPRDTFRTSMERMHEDLNRDMDRSEHQMHELTLFSNILVRMQRREEITDDMWAAVGLSPDVVLRGGA